MKSRATTCSCLLILSRLACASAARADVDPAQERPRTEAPAHDPLPKPYLVHLNLAVNAYTYLGPIEGEAEASAPSAHLWPGNRLSLLQQLGFGVWVHPNVRLQLTLQLVETVTNLPRDVSPLTLMGVIPWVVFTHGYFFGGVGPLLAWWSYGQADAAAGVFLATGFSIPVGGGWALGAGVQGPLLWGQRFSFAVSPTAILSHRF